MALAQEPHYHTTAEVFLMLYIVSKVNATEWFVHGGIILLASHRNGSITPPLPKKWPNGQVVKNKTGGYLEWLSCSNHMTIQLHRCS